MKLGELIEELEEAKKDLGYYMSLHYKTKVCSIPEEEGGGFEASIPQLGRHAFTGSGDTVLKALESLDRVKRDYFERYLADGTPIPEPE